MTSSFSNSMEAGNCPRLPSPGTHAAVFVRLFELGASAVFVVIFLALLVTVTNGDSRPYNNVIYIAKDDTLQNELSQRVNDAVVAIWSDGCLDEQ